MNKSIKRRSFIDKSVKVLAGAGIFAMFSCKTSKANSMQNLFIHHVYFWLKEPVTQAVRSRFEEELKKLVKVETIVDHHLGIPAGTNREVIDSSYTYSLLVTFRNREDQDIYQTHPIHLKFIEECSELWQKVVVYDSISI